MDVEKILKTDGVFKKFIQISNLSDGFELYRKTIFYDALKKGENFHKKHNSLAFYDIFLDHMFISHLFQEFKRLKSSDQRLLEDYIYNFINYYNLKTLIRGLNLGFEKNFLTEILIFNDFFINELLKLEEMEDLIDYMRNHSKFSDYFKFGKLNNIEDILTHFRDTFHEICLNLLNKWSKGDSFNILFPVSFLLRKRFEIEDLKTISVALEYNLPPEEILKKTILCR